jgi:hypothetical protein
MSNFKSFYAIRTRNGNYYSPSFSFIDNSRFGLYYNAYEKYLGITAKGDVMKIYEDWLEVSNGLRFRNYISGGYLYTNPQGEVEQRRLPTSKSGSVNLDLYYEGLNSIQRSITIEYDEKFDYIPAINATIESEVNTDLSIKINNKTEAKFDLSYNKQNLINKIFSGSGIVSNINVVRHYDNTIGISFYDTIEDRIKYVCSRDYKGCSWYDPVIVDDVSSIGQNSVIIFNNVPAIAYFLDNGNNDELRFVIANDSCGKSWGTPTTLYITTQDLTFGISSVFLLNNSGILHILYNSDNGAANIITAADSQATSWGSPQQISNLVNHEIINARIVDGSPAILAKSNAVNNVYYVRSTDGGLTWPIGATELIINGNVSLPVVSGVNNSCICVIDNYLCVLVSSLEDNKLYISRANDSVGASWGYLTSLISTESTNIAPCVFQVNGKSFILYNEYIGGPSRKKILKVNDINTLNITSTTFELNYLLTTYHAVLPNIEDEQTSIYFTSSESINVLKYYRDTYINWIAHQT